ncbi:MAG: hypothetical protein AB7S86_19115 [Hydrogenophaga sp.]|uniref:hypothetical protein n=1 Tax=Hydrogenophaga sp. TaxID=1904254 RepID=UPI003D10CFDC
MEATEFSQLPTDEPIDAKFDLIQGAIVVHGHALRFWGGRGVQHLFLGVGRSFDLTCGVGGADRLYLQGSSAQHRVVVSGDVLTLLHEAQGTEVSLHASRGPRELVFEDGAVTLGSLWRSSRQVSALLGVVGEAAAGALATVASHVRAAPRAPVGALPDGAVLQVEGVGGVETVYVGGSEIQVHLAGRLAEHRVAVKGQALALGRRASGLLEMAYVVGSQRLAFADGEVAADALFHAVQHNEPWPVPHGARTPELPRITAVALDFDSADGAWSDEWPGALPSGLFAGCRAGQAFEASVSLEEAVKVEGSPRLQLCVAGRRRAAQYMGGSGTNTLRFVYTVTEEDVAMGASCDTKGMTLTASGNLDVEVGPVLTSGAAIRPLQPVMLLASAANQPVLQTPAESDWQTLISESERRLARDLVQLDEPVPEVARTAGARWPMRAPCAIDVELDLLLDVDLTALERSVEMA